VKVEGAPPGDFSQGLGVNERILCTETQHHSRFLFAYAPRYQAVLAGAAASTASQRKGCSERLSVVGIATTMSKMFVIKRDGRQEQVHFDKITARIMKLSYGLNPDFCDPVSCLASPSWPRRDSNLQRAPGSGPAHDDRIIHMPDALCRFVEIVPAGASGQPAASNVQLTTIFKRPASVTALRQPRWWLLQHGEATPVDTLHPYGRGVSSAALGRLSHLSTRMICSLKDSQWRSSHAAGVQATLKVHSRDILPPEPS